MKPTLLVVDDEQIVSEAIAQLASWIGFRVCRAPNAAEGMRFLTGGNIDVVITDLNMPGRSGIGFLSEARFAGHEQPFIIVTGFATKENAIEALRLGALDFLEKPFEADDLQNLLRAAVGLGVGTNLLPDILKRLTILTDKLRLAADPPTRQRTLEMLHELFATQATPGSPESSSEPRLRAAALGARAARLLQSLKETPSKEMARVMGFVANLFQRSCDPDNPNADADLQRFAAVLVHLEQRDRAVS